MLIDIKNLDLNNMYPETCRALAEVLLEHSKILDKKMVALQIEDGVTTIMTLSDGTILKSYRGNPVIAED